MKRIPRYWVFLLPSLLIFLFLFLIPILHGLALSFFEYHPTRFWIERFTLHNYARFILDGYYQAVLLRTVLLAVVVTVLTLVISYPVAYIIARMQSRALRSLLIIAFLSPYFVGVIVRLYGWMYILSDNGLVNNILMSLGLINEPIHLIWNMSGVTIGLVEVSLTVAIFTIYGVIGGIDRTLERAARTVGATPLQTFRKITFPLSLPGVVAASMLVMGVNLGTFLHPMLLGGGRVTTLGTIVYSRILGIMNYPFGSAVGFIMLGLFLLFLLIYVKVVKKITAVQLGM